MCLDSALQPHRSGVVLATEAKFLDLAVDAGGITYQLLGWSRHEARREVPLHVWHPLRGEGGAALF